jgi:hypothetical protein
MEICEFFKDFYTHNGYRENRILNVVVPKKLSPFLGWAQGRLGYSGGFWALKFRFIESSLRIENRDDRYP